MRQDEGAGAGRIALAVVALVAGVGIIVGSLIYWATTLNAGESAYGTIDIPGATVLHLPAGRVDLSFTMDYSNDTVDIPVLSMRVTPAAGGPAVPLVAHIGAPNSDNGVTHVRVGTLALARAGEYRVTVDGDVNGDPAPRLHLGRIGDHVPMLIGGLVAGGLLLVAGVVLVVVAVRRRGPAEATTVTGDDEETPEPGGPSGPLPAGAQQPTGPGLPPGSAVPTLLAATDDLRGLQPATATVLAAHDVTVAPGAAVPLGGVVDLTFDVVPAQGEGYATTVRVPFATPERRSTLARPGQTLPVLVDPLRRDRLAIDTERASLLPE